MDWSTGESFSFKDASPHDQSLHLALLTDSYDHSLLTQKVPVADRSDYELQIALHEGLSKIHGAEGIDFSKLPMYGGWEHDDQAGLHRFHNSPVEDRATSQIVSAFHRLTTGMPFHRTGADEATDTLEMNIASDAWRKLQQSGTSSQVMKEYWAALRAEVDLSELAKAPDDKQSPYPALRKFLGSLNREFTQAEKNRLMPNGS